MGSDTLIELALNITKNITNKKYFIVYAIMSILMSSLIWFISIFLLATHFYETNNIWISIIFSFCLGVVWFSLIVMEMFATFEIASFLNRFLLEDTSIIKFPLLKNILYFGASFCSIILLCGEIGTAYMLKVDFKIPVDYKFLTTTKFHIFILNCGFHSILLFGLFLLAYSFGPFMSLIWKRLKNTK